MEKIVVRSAHRSNGQAQLQSLMQSHCCDSAQKLIEKLGEDQVLKLIYQDELGYDE